LVLQGTVAAHRQRGVAISPLLGRSPSSEVTKR
jgi:hypothetical protein